jgi:hypothetical protein
MDKIKKFKGTSALPSGSKATPSSYPGYYYTLLVKYNKNDLIYEDEISALNRSISVLKSKKLHITELKIETGSDGKLHLHCLCFSLKKIYFKKFQIKNYFISFQPRKSEPRYRSYIMKEQETIEWYKENYGFIESLYDA